MKKSSSAWVYFIVALGAVACCIGALVYRKYRKPNKEEDVLNTTERMPLVDEKTKPEFEVNGATGKPVILFFKNLE